MENKKITAALIIEVIGKPPEHLKEVLETISNKISQENAIEIKSKKINESELLKDQKDIYTNFLELEIQAETLQDLTKITLFYMPAHIDILEPEKISLSNNVLTEIYNALTQKLHTYDETARILQTKNKILIKKIKELMPDKKEEK